MGIRSQVRVEYWQDDVKVEPTELLLYPEGSDVISQADIGLKTAVFSHGVDTAWNLASLTASTGNGGLLSAGFKFENLLESIRDLKSELSSQTVIRSTNLNVAYPHPLFNTIRLIFESQSTEEFFGVPGELRDAGHTPWAGATNPEIQFVSNCGRFHRNATYIIKLDDLNKRFASTSQGFFSTPDALRPFVFQFATKETDSEGVSRSVLHSLSLSIFKQRQAVPQACTEVVYWMRASEDGFGQMVARRRLVDFAPRIWPLSPGAGDDFQFADVPLVLENGNYVVDGSPYNFVSVNFSVVSRRKHDGRRLPIEVGADHVPFAGGVRVPPYVTQPTLAPAVDDRGQPYLAEGVGSATVILSPENASPGTIVFSANQEPSEWGTRQNIRVFRGTRAAGASAASNASANAARSNERRNEPFCASQD
jgi:hypothetical protein